jgi:hypothetical protein
MLRELKKTQLMTIETWGTAGCRAPDKSAEASAVGPLRDPRCLRLDGVDFGLSKAGFGKSSMAAGITHEYSSIDPSRLDQMTRAGALSKPLACKMTL